MSAHFNQAAKQVVPPRSARASRFGAPQEARSKNAESILARQFMHDRFPPKMSGDFSGGAGSAMASEVKGSLPGNAEPGGLDAETLASLRQEIRAGFGEAFTPLRQLAGEMEQAMRKVSDTLARIRGRRVAPR